MPENLEIPAKIKLSEAISLGHTLIGEKQDRFLYDGCGCAIGSALAAMGFSNQFEAPGGGGIDNLKLLWPWTAERVGKYPSLMKDRIPYYQSVAGTISDLHRSGIPRMEIAKMIAEIEPEIETVEETSKIETEVTQNA